MIESLTHGWSGLAMAYAAVQAPMLAALARKRADLHQFVLSPSIAVPLTAVVGLAAAATSSGLGLAPEGVLSFTLGLGASAAAGYGGGLWMGRGGAVPQVHRRGSLVDEHIERTASRTSRSSSQVHWAGRSVPLEDETKHFKLIGTTGTGKSTAIGELLEGALARGDRAVIADPDGGYLRRFRDAARGDVMLNPFEEGSVRWDLFAEIRSAYDVDQLARALIPDQGGAERSWRGYARTFFSAVARQLHAADIRDTAELFRLLVVADAAELRTLVRGTPAQPFLDEHNSRMFDSIRSVTSSAVAGLDPVAHQSGPGFSVRDWIDGSRSGVLFIPYRANQIPSLGPLISAWMRLALFQTMDQPLGSDAARPRPTWFAVDEIDALGPIDGLKDALARVRKFGGRIVLGFQSVAQVSSTYGAGDAHTIVENAGNTLILRCSASEGGGTARFASQLIGEREIQRTNLSHSRRPSDWLSSVSRSEHVTLEQAVLPAQIEQLPDLMGYMKHASEPRWRLVRLDPPRSFQPRTPAPAATRDRSAAHDYQP
jgi:hypothetical protein